MNSQARSSSLELVFMNKLFLCILPWLSQLNAVSSKAIWERGISIVPLNSACKLASFFPPFSELLSLVLTSRTCCSNNALMISTFCLTACPIPEVLWVHFLTSRLPQITLLPDILPLYNGDLHVLSPVEQFLRHPLPDCKVSSWHMFWRSAGGTTLFLIPFSIGQLTQK